MNPQRPTRKVWAAPTPPPVRNPGLQEERTFDDTKRVVRRLMPLLRPHRARIVGAVVLVVLYALSVLAGPFLLKLAIDHGIAHGDGRVLNIIVASSTWSWRSRRGGSRAPRSG